MFREGDWEKARFHTEILTSGLRKRSSAYFSVKLFGFTLNQLRTNVIL